MRAFHAMCLAASLTACGAKTGLLVPDAQAPADVPDAIDAVDAADAVDACAPRALPVERFAAEVIFVIDRSGSMSERTRSGVTRWSALTTALGRALPAVDRELWVGLIQFPGSISGANQCGELRALDLSPRLMNAGAVLAALRSTTPAGGTPTYDALQAAADYYRTSPPVGRVRGRYLVLATDGGPNCNPALPGATCVCTSRGCTLPRGGLSCLDDARTVDALQRLNAAGVASFVIGIPGEDAPYLPETLERMAVAGGRPHMTPGQPSYYRAEEVDEFTTAFQSITTALVRCRYVTNPVADPSRVSLRVGGREFPRDATRADGWDWVNVAGGEVALYGAACEAAQAAGGGVTLRYDCAE